MNDLFSIISSLGFPIVACIGLAWFCRYMIDTNEKSNEENREAIKALNESVSRLCDKLDDIKR